MNITNIYPTTIYHTKANRSPGFGRLITPAAMLLLLMLSLQVVGHSKTESGTATDLESHLTSAAQNNPEVLAVYQRWLAAREKIPQARALPDPTFTFSWFLQEVETRVGPQKGKIGVMQRFPWFGKLKLKGNSATTAAKAEKQRYETVKLMLFYKIKSVYYQYYLTHRTIALLEENIKLLHGLENVLMAKYRAGTAQYGSLLKIQMEREKLKNRLTGKQKLLSPLRTQFNALLNRHLNHPLPAPKTIPAHWPQLSHAQLTETLKANNPGLKAAQLMVEKGSTDIQWAKKRSLPDISLGLNYILTAQSDMPEVMDNGKDPLAATLSVHLPIWSRKNKAAVKAARAVHKAAEYNHRRRGNQLAVRLDMVFFQYEDAGRKITLYEKSLIPRAEQTLEVIRSGFETGTGDYIDLIDAQRTLLAFQLEYQEAITRQAQRLAELEMIVGKDNPGATK